MSMQGMTGSDRSGADEAGVKWLTAEELDSWLSVVRLMTWLPWSIDQQLQRDSKLGMVEYQVLAMLSESPERTKRMSSLAEVTNASLSRLSRVVKRLEERGLVRREPHPDDRRKLLVDITDKARVLVGRMLPSVHSTSMEMLEDVTEADREALIRVLAQMRANVEAMNARPVPEVELRRRVVRSSLRAQKRSG